MVSAMNDDDYLELATAAIFSAIFDMDRDKIDIHFDSLVERLETESERELLPGLMMSTLDWAGGDDFDTLFKKATAALTSLRRRRLERRLETIQIEMGQAEREQDLERIQLLFAQKIDLQNRRLALSE
jgi:hypothetical protein